MTFDRSVSVVIPTIQGREVLLRDAIKSALNQTEWTAHPHRAPWPVVVEPDINRLGAAAARNWALQKVNTEWVAFLDDDDILYPRHLEVCLDAAQSSGADLVYPYPDFGVHRDPLATAQYGRVVRPFGVPFGPEQEQWLRQRGGFIPVTHLVRRQLVMDVGGFPEQGSFLVPAGNNSGQCEDYGLLLRLLNAGARFHHVPEVTWLYRLHDSNTGGRPHDGK